MTNRKPFPILSALRREQDTFTINALGLWRLEYQDVTPQIAANDNDPETRPIEQESYRYELTAEELIAAHNDGTYSAALHGETRKPQIKRIKKPMPLPPDVDAEDETARHIDAVKMRLWLGCDAEILDMAIGPHTYIDVGRYIGIVGSAKTAYRAGRLEVKGAASVFYKQAV